jgi:imidazolonepropionase-like amidohydrolase
VSRPPSISAALLSLLASLAGCSHAATSAPSPVTDEPPATPRTLRFVNARNADGSALAFTVTDGKVVKDDATTTEVVDLAGAFVAPAFIDSHVHLAYDPRGPALRAGGIAGAVDLAAPLRELESPAPGGPLLLQAGPMLTALKGYPTQSWGSNGYGWELQGADDAVSAVEALKASGARVIKFALAGAPELDDAALSRAVKRAQEIGLKTVAHALSAQEAERAALAGVDVLAHTPTELLPEGVLALWSNRAVISTLGAFGGAGALENLKQLRARGAKVFYGTDFGNTGFAGIQPAELQALQLAGFDGAAIIAAGTSDPADFWGFSELGTLVVGARASFLVLDESPIEDPLTLSRPRAVYMDGARP